MYNDIGILNDTRIPGALLQEFDNGYNCCGNCKVVAEKVELIYWPSKSTAINSCCSRYFITSQMNLSHSDILKARDEAVLGNVSTKVVDGFTL